MTLPIRKYNPAFLNDNDLVTSFCVRTKEFCHLVETLRKCTDASNSHQLVIGPRGTGKTTLLLRVVAEVRRDAELKARYFPVVFPEENYEVATANQFWLACLTHLAEQAPPNRKDGLTRTVGELRAVRDDRVLGDRCLGALLDFADRQDKRLLLLVENLNMMFRDMADPDAGSLLRNVLQTDGRIVLFASATNRFAEIDNSNYSLYRFFDNTHTLNALDTDDCVKLWTTLTGSRLKKEAMRALEILTGGSPRLIAIVARFNAGRSPRELITNLFDLVDDHTEYFRSHLESLPSQERRVFLALAVLWKPALAREIAEHARLEPSQCSAHLARLCERGMVDQMKGSSAKRKQYYVTERLYNIYYLLRRGETGPVVNDLVAFMVLFYSRIELDEICNSEMDSPATKDERVDQAVTDLQQALRARLKKSPDRKEDSLVFLSEMDSPDPKKAVTDLQQALHVRLRKSPDQKDDAFDDVVCRFGANETPDGQEAVALAEEAVATALVKKGVAFDSLKQSDDALAAYDEVVRRFEKSGTPAVQEVVGQALACRGITLLRLRRYDDALAASDEIFRRFGTNETPALQEAVATAFVNQGVASDGLGRSDDALATYDEVVRRFGTNEMPFLQETVQSTLARKGILLFGLQRFDDALAAFDEVCRFGTSEIPARQEMVAAALVKKGDIFHRLQRPDDALAAYDEVVHRFGKKENETPLLQEAVRSALARKGVLQKAVATTLVKKGVAFDSLKQSDNALAAYDEVVRRFEKDGTPAVQEVVGQALACRGITLIGLRRYDDALAASDEIFRRFGTNETPALQEAVATAFVNQGVAFDGLGRSDDALAAYDEVVRRFGTNEMPFLQETVQSTLARKGILLFGLRRFDDALAAFDEVCRFGTSEIPARQEMVAAALVKKGDIFHRLQQPDDALATYDEVMHRFGRKENETPLLQEVVQSALAQKGALLFRLRRFNDALAAFDDVVHRFGASEIPTLQEMVAAALVRKGDIFHRLRRPDDALAAYDEAVGRFETSGRRQEIVETAASALSGMADLELERGKIEAAIETAEKMLKVLIDGDSPLSEKVFDTLMNFSVELEPERVRDLILISHSVALVQPLVVALEKDLGLAPRVAVEVDEVAEDIRKELKARRALPEWVLGILMDFSVELGPKRMRELIKASRSAALLRPLLVALQEDLGLAPRVPRMAQEVKEVADEIKEELERRASRPEVSDS